MKFLFSHEFPFQYLRYGGGQQIVRGLARQLASWGHEVHVASTGVDEMGVTQADAPVNFHLSGEYNKRWSGLHTAWLAMRLAFELRPDWVCCFTSEAALVVPFCQLMKIQVTVYEAAPDLVSFRFTGWRTLRTIRYKLGVFLHFLGAHLCKRVTTISEFSSRQAQENWGIAAEKLRTVGTGLDEVFIEENVPIRPVPHRPLRFISVGRLTLDQKPLQVMAEALKELSVPWQSWTIVGSGPDEPVLQATLRRLALEEKVVFLGTKHSQEIAQLLTEHDMVLLPSSHESFFLTAYEAAAKGRLVVTNDVADVKAYFADAPSVVVADKVSPEAYRCAIVQAAQLVDSMESHCVKTAQRVKRDYSWPVVADRFLQALA